jgi:hypothetical protein
MSDMLYLVDDYQKETSFPEHDKLKHIGHPQAIVVQFGCALQ